MENIKRKKGLQSNIIVNFIILFFFVSFLTGLFQYNQRSRLLIKNSGDEASNLAAAASLLIDGDIHQNFKDESDQLTNDFKTIREKLQEFQVQTGVEGVYTLIEKSEDLSEFIIDAAEDEPTEIGYEYENLPAMKKAFSGMSAADEDITTDEWGSWLSGYAPVKNSGGDIVAIVGIDIDAADILAEKRQMLFSTGLSILISIALAFIFGWILSSRIVKPIHILNERFKELSKSGGDLTKKIEIKTGDEVEELAGSVSHFIEDIKDIVVQINQTSLGVRDSAKNLNNSIHQSNKAVEEISGSIQNIAIGASEQASDVSDISVRIKKISDDIGKNKDNINKINNSAQSTNELITEGIEAVKNQNIKTKDNMHAFNNVMKAVTDLSEQTHEVESILDTITGISEQTNLLALNAAIEAARAGEHGRGFAVVADEVRKLAEGSKIAASEISLILTKIKGNSSSAVQEINKAELISKQQQSAVEKTGMIFNDIEKNIKLVTGGVEDISIYFNELGDNTKLISDKITDIAGVSEENAAISEEVSASSEQQNETLDEISQTAEKLNELSHNLNAVISKFKI